MQNEEKIDKDNLLSLGIILIFLLNIIIEEPSPTLKQFSLIFLCCNFPLFYGYLRFDQFMSLVIGVIVNYFIYSFRMKLFS
jgi:hypothetical protein